MNGTAFGPDLSLTPSQEGLLHTALSSNNPTKSSSQTASTRPAANARFSSDQKYNAGSAMANGANLYTSPIQQTPGSGQLSNFDESPSFLDYDLDDGNFDWDNSGDRLLEICLVLSSTMTASTMIRGRLLAARTMKKKGLARDAKGMTRVQRNPDVSL